MDNLKSKVPKDFLRAIEENRLDKLEVRTKNPRKCRNCGCNCATRRLKNNR